MVMIREKYCRFLFGMGLAFAVLGTTTYAQTTPSFFLGQTVPYPILSQDQNPSQFVEKSVQKSTEKRALFQQPEFEEPFYDYNYYYYNHNDRDAVVAESGKSTPGKPTKIAGSRTAADAKTDSAPASSEDSISQSASNKKVYPRDNVRRYARNYWFGDWSESWKPTTVPNMIGDNTMSPARVLSYTHWTTHKVPVLNPGYNPTPEFYNYGIDNLDYSQPSKFDNRQYINIDEAIQRTETLPMPVTPTMFITSLNVAENFNAEVANRFYADLRVFDGGQTYGVAEDQNPRALAKKDMSRLTLGFEKQIGYRHSLELRLPIVLVGLNSTQNIVGLTDPEQTGEFGNFSLIYKNVMYRTPEVTFCWGIGLNAPTAPDVKLTYSPGFGRDDIRGKIENRKVSFVPYLGFQWDRKQSQTFGHLLGQIDMTVGKNRLRFTDDRYGLTNYERELTEASLFRFNLGAGRWFFSHATNPSLFRIGGMAEVHTTSNINNLNSKTIYSNAKSSESYFSATATKRNWMVINLAFGIPIQTRGATIQPFLVVPVTNVRYFDCEGGISADLRF